MFDDIFNGFTQFDAIWQIMQGNDPITNRVILCVLLDSVAGQTGNKGYELFPELMPLLLEVGDALGVLAG